MSRAHRGTIYLEDAEVVEHVAHDGAQQVLRLQAPRAAAAAAPGMFAHIQCHPELPMRRPMSVMRADPERGWIEFLYKVVGHGTRLLARKVAGDRVSVLGPIGRGFSVRKKTHDYGLIRNAWIRSSAPGPTARPGSRHRKRFPG